MLNMKLRTDLSRKVGGGATESFRDVMQMDTEEAQKALQAKSTGPQRLMRLLGRAKATACWPMALAAYPYVRLIGLKGAYLYCLAQLAELRTDSKTST
jgi:hypothetical protein